MPFQSRAQQRFAFSTHQPWAKRWAKQTDFAGLPERKDAGATAGAMAHGPGGLLSTPGLGTRKPRKGRKWGMKLKEGYNARAGETIRGNLGRSTTGQFTRVGGPSSDAPPRFGKAPKQPKRGRAARKPKPTDAQRTEARNAKRQQNAADVAKRMADSDTGLAPGGSAALLAFASGTPPTPEQGAGLASMGLAEQAADGSYRMTPTGHAAAQAMQAGDYQRAVDAVSRGADAVGKRTQRATEHTARQQATAAKRTASEAARAARRAEVAARRAAKKPAKAGGGGGGSKQPSDGNPTHAPAAPRAFAPAKRRAGGASAPSAGGSDGAAPKKPAAEKPAKAPAKQISPALRDAASAVSEGSDVSDAQIQQLVTNGLVKLSKDGDPVLTAAGLRATMKEASLIVYKDHAGTPRWLARTTTAYKDRDNEIISSDALDQDSQRMTAAKQFGPLRYWHVGQPDPFDVANPAGPGLDIGDCDYSCLIGRTRIEGGTFRDPRIAQTIARQADRYELSPGFFHPLDQPGQDGVYTTIRTFERSIVPTTYGRASNLFTGLAVKEQRMDVNEMEKRFKTAIHDLGLDAEQATALGMELVRTEKEAAAQGIAFKSDDAPDYPDVVINGVTYKAAPPPPPDMAAMAPDAEDPAETAAEGGVEEPGDEMGGDYLGDMSWDEFAAKLGELLAPVLKMQDMMKAMGDMHGELKTMYGGVATKDDARAAELITLKAQYTELATRIAQIEGDQPSVVLPDEVAEALKSAGPAKPATPENPALAEVLNNPQRPLAWLGMQTFPELYNQNGENT